MTYARVGEIVLTDLVGIQGQEIGLSGFGVLVKFESDGRERRM